MLAGGSRSKGTLACLFPFCGLSARRVLVAVLVFVFSSPLSIASILTTHCPHKAPRITVTKAEALSATCEKFSLDCRTAHRRVATRPCLVSIFPPAHDRLGPIFRPLRC